MQTHTLFRGITRPAMFFGVPLVAFFSFVTPLWTIAPLFIAFFPIIGFLSVIVGTIFLFLYMKEQTKKDNEYFLMKLVDFREKAGLVSQRKDKVYLIPPRKLRVEKEFL